MKKFLILMSVPVLFAACEPQNIFYKLDYSITLDEENTYYAGEPVKFNINGLVDNLLFYSGEIGSQYMFKDRYSVSVEDVESATLNLSINARYGVSDALEIYVTNSFDGLSGTDGMADREKIQAMVDGGMQGWTKVYEKDGTLNTFVSYPFDVSEYLDNFAVALHWCPPTETETQRTYQINGNIALKINGMEPTSMDISQLDFVTVMMNEELDPYHKNAGNGSIRYDVAAAYVVFQGVGANALKYPLDGWVISTPRALNRISNDKGLVIKNLQNYMSSYEYTYEEPGTYMTTFVGTNANFVSTDTQVDSIKVTIVDAPLGW